MPVTGQGLADLLSGAGGAPVDRPALNNFVATSQARNGLVSAQTQDAMLKASQAQEEQAARARLKDNYVKSGLKESDAQLAADISIGGFGNAEVALKALGQTKLGTGTPADQVSGQQMYEGKVAPPVGVPNTYIMPPGSGLSNAPILQTNQGAALTSRQQSLTGVDVARAEELHAKAKNDLTAGTSTLSPAALHEAALVTMADPSKMSTYAGYGATGTANRNAINNERARMLNDSNMTPDDMIAHRALTKASVGSAGAAAKQQQILDAFLPLVKNNSARISTLLDQIDASGSAGLDEPIVNGFERMLGRKLNSDDLTELHSVFTAYQAEVGRLLASGPSMNGVISNEARNKVDSMAPETMSASGARRVLNRVNTELDIRRLGVHNSLTEATNAQLPVTSTPHNAPHTGTPTPAVGEGATDSDLPPGFKRLN